MSGAGLAAFQAAVADMDLPPSRKASDEAGDLRWLARNMGIRNAGHPRYAEAMDLLRRLLRSA
jgi:hypothetical protein